MKRYMTKLTTTINLLLICGSLLILPTKSFSQPSESSLANQGIIKKLDQILKGVYTLPTILAPYLQFIQTEEYQSTPDLEKIQVGNAASLNQNQYVNKQTNYMLNTTIAGLLDNSNSAETIQDKMASNPASDYPNTTDQNNNNQPNTTPTFTNAQIQGNNSLNVDSLFTPLYYKPSKNGNDNSTDNQQNSASRVSALNFCYSQQASGGDSATATETNFSNLSESEQALNFICYLANLSNPSTTLNLNKLVDTTLKNNANPNLFPNKDISQSDAVKQAGALPQVQDYRLALRNLVAYKSVALAELYHIYQERVPIENLAKTAGLPPNKQISGSGNNDNNNNNKHYASIRQVDQYMATRRLNPAWYSLMEQQPKATVLREILYLLAEERYEQYKQREELERLNLLMAASILQGAAAGDLQLGIKKTNAQKAINPKINQPPATTTNMNPSVESLQQ